jgi:dipeptidyl aminopeptidase/acylaminoacyl peptidase
VGVSDQDGTSVWFCNLGEPAPPREVLRVNKHLASVKSSSRKFLDYVTADGKGLKALALLPPDYRPETRYPMVVWVYAGMLVDQSSRPDLSFDDDAFDNPRLLAGHGYLVLFPSIPLTPYGQPGDPVSQMTASVTSAVDRAVADGLADPARVGVIGHSYGGYTTLSLVTRTHRFAAAVAIAGTSDLFSFYGGFDPHDRYSDPLISQPFGPGLFELSQFRMGKPPWEDPQRYLRNSPVLHLDQTTTPLMLIAGDLDPAMAQAEETSTALARLGKTGRLVRYYGEDHVLDSPANIRDMWQRIFAWTDKYLKG